MRKILKPLLLLFSLLFLTSTVLKSQKNFHTHMKSMVLCNEGILCSLTYDTVDFLNGQSFHTASDDENVQYSDDSVAYCVKISRIMQLFMALSFLLPAVRSVNYSHNKFHEITFRKATVF